MAFFSKKKGELPRLEPTELPTYEPVSEEEISRGDESKAGSPLFVKVEDYKHVLDTLKRLKAKLADAESILEKLSGIKAEEDKELESWKRDLETIKRQLMAIDNKLFEV
ncbi:hypothetical protein HZB88_05480 [archaeon]|nr:hypothetical protein [archaeon]